MELYEVNNIDNNNNNNNNDDDDNNNRVDNMYCCSRVNLIYLGQTISKIQFEVWIRPL